MIRLFTLVLFGLYLLAFLTITAVGFSTAYATYIVLKAVATVIVVIYKEHFSIKGLSKTIDAAYYSTLVAICFHFAGASFLEFETFDVYLLLVAAFLVKTLEYCLKKLILLLEK